MSFGAPVWFWALLVLPALGLLFLRAEQRSAERLKEFVAPKLVAATRRDRESLPPRFALRACCSSASRSPSSRWRNRVTATPTRR